MIHLQCRHFWLRKSITDEAKTSELRLQEANQGVYDHLLDTVYVFVTNSHTQILFCCVLAHKHTPSTRLQPAEGKTWRRSGPWGQLGTPAASAWSLGGGGRGGERVSHLLFCSSLPVHTFYWVTEYLTSKTEQLLIQSKCMTVCVCVWGGLQAWLYNADLLYVTVRLQLQEVNIK